MGVAVEDLVEDLDEDLDEDLVDDEVVWWAELVAVVLFLMVLVDLMVLVLV